MTKYIDTDKLIAHIEKLFPDSSDERIVEGFEYALDKVKTIIDSLPQEPMKETYCSRSEKWKEVEETARHEYENGWKNCKKHIMNGAVEGEISSVDVGDDSYVKTLKIPDIQKILRKFDKGNKVKIIIVKEE